MCRDLCILGHVVTGRPSEQTLAACADVVGVDFTKASRQSHVGSPQRAYSPATCFAPRQIGGLREKGLSLGALADTISTVNKTKQSHKWHVVAQPTQALHPSTVEHGQSRHHRVGSSPTPSTRRHGQAINTAAWQL